jgi:hypothetical protein
MCFRRDWSASGITAFSRTARAHHIDLARQLIGGRFLPPVSPMPTDDRRGPHCGTGTLRVVGPVPAERPPPLREDLL